MNIFRHEEIKGYLKNGWSGISPKKERCETRKKPMRD